MSLWLLFTLAAAFLQNLRSALQKAIKGRLSTAGSAYVRFFYAWPFALVFWLAVPALTGADALAPADFNRAFFLYCALGGISQILFTIFLLWTFSFRSFAVGTTFSKLEVIFVAILSFLILADTIPFLAIIAISLGCFGAILLSQTDAPSIFSLKGFAHRSTWLGLASALFLGASSVFFRAAIVSLPEAQGAGADNFILRASSTLALALIFQTIVMGGWFVLFDRSQLAAIIRHWRHALPIGILGMVTSLSWFCAFALQNATYVRAVGQIELVFTFCATLFFFREKIRFHELGGIVLIVSAILLIILVA